MSFGYPGDTTLHFESPSLTGGFTFVPAATPRRGVAGTISTIGALLSTSSGTLLTLLSPAAGVDQLLIQTDPFAHFHWERVDGRLWS